MRNKLKILILLVLATAVSCSTVLGAAVNQYTSYFRVSSVFIPADEMTACSVSIYIKDENGSPLSGKTVTVSASLTGASVTQPGATDASGMCTAVVKSRKLGECNITASCDAVAIKENYIPNASFESGSGGDADSWAEAGTHTRNNEQHHGSTGWALKSLNTPQNATFSAMLNFPSYSYFKMSGWMYNSLTAGSQYCDMNDSHLPPSGDPESEDLSLFGTRGLGAWEYKEDTWYSASLTARNFRCVTDGNNTGACWFDNARMERVPTVQFRAGCLRLTAFSIGITVNNPSAGIRIEAQDFSGTMDSADNGTAVLQTSSPTGELSVSRITWQNTGMIYLSSGSGGFHYKDSVAGDYVITVSRSGMMSDTIVISVLDPSAYDSACLVSSPFAYVPATGTDSITIIVTVKDTFEYPVAGITVTLSTNRGLSYTSISANPQTSDSTGQCTWTLSSVFTGTDTVFFDCGKGLYSNIYYDGFTLYGEGSDGSPNWNIQQGTWRVSDGTYCGENSGDNDYFAVGASGGDINWEDVTINAKFRCASFGEDWRDSCRIGFRYQDNNNGYTLEFINGYDRAWISKKSQGVSTGDPGVANPPLSTNNGPIGHKDGNWHKVRIGLTGSHINVIFDSAQIFDVTDNNYKSVPALYYGKLMLSAHDYTLDSVHSTKAYYDEIQVSPLTVIFTGLADHLAVSSSGISAGNAGLITIESQDTQGNKVSSFNGTATLSTSSPTGRFSLSRTTWADTSIMEIANGSGKIYYYDSSSGNKTITILSILNPATSTLSVLSTPARNTPSVTIDQIHYLYCNLGGSDQNVGVTHVDVLPGDGVTTPTSMGGISCRALRDDLAPEYGNKYMYFDVFDGYIYNNTNSKWRNVLVGMRYYDKGTGNIYLQYDGQGDTYEQCSLVLQMQNSLTWKNTCFVIDNPRFANRQWCGTDFRLYCPSGNMYIARVTVHRAPGQNIGPTRDLTGELSFTTTDKLLITSNLFDWWVFDGWNPLDDWDQDDNPPAGLGFGVHPKGLHPSNPVQVDYSAGAGNYARCKSLAKRLIRDCILSGFDMIKPNYCGQSGDGFYLAWVKGIVSALEDLETEGYIVPTNRIPKVVQFIESYFSGEGELEYAGQKLDCTTERGKAIMYDKIRDFWSMIPTKWWGMVDNQPLIFLYGAFDVAASNQSTWDYIGQHFQQDFGRRPFILYDWDSSSSNGNVTLENWHWGEGQIGPPNTSLKTPGTGAHYHDLYCRPSPRGGVRDPMNGEWARVGLDSNDLSKDGGWDGVLLHMLANPSKHKICVATFNELAEGSGIQDSCEFGRKDLKDMAFYKRMWKCNPIRYKFSDLTSFAGGELTHQLSFFESPPVSVKPGQSFPVKIIVRNTGAVGWCNYTFHAAPNYSRGVVRLGCKQPVSAFAKMYESMAPGDTQVLVLNLTAPDSETTYTFKFDMHNFGQASPWFTDIDGGNSTLDAVISVTSSCSLPSQPVFTKIETSTEQVTLAWSAAQGPNPVKGYYVYYGVDPDTAYYFLDNFSAYGEKGSMLPVWEIQSGEWTVKTKDVYGYNWVNVNNGLLEGVNSGADDSAPVGIVTGDPYAADYTLELKFKIVHTGTDDQDAVRIGFRFRDPKNCYSLDILPKTASNNIRLIRIKNGEVTTLASYSKQLYENGIYWWQPLYSKSLCYKSWAYDVWHTVKITAQGAQITVWFDGTQAISYYDFTPVPKGRITLSARRHSLATHDSFFLFDDVKITPIGQGIWFLYKTTTDTSVVYSGLEIGKDFSFKVCAFDSSGNTGAFSGVWTTAVPTGLAITTGQFRPEGCSFDTGYC